jgi:hypothetical protein
MGTGKCGVDKGGCGATVNQGGCLDMRALGDEGDGDNEEIWRIRFVWRSRRAVNGVQDGRCGSRNGRTRWMAQRRVLYCL